MVQESKEAVKRYLRNLRSEQEAMALYERMALGEPNPDLAEVYRKLARTEQKHVDFWAAKLQEAGVSVPLYRPSLRNRLLGWLAQRMGTSAILPAIVAGENSGAQEYNNQTDAVAANLHTDEQSHARIFGYLAKNTQGITGSEVARFEGRHRGAGGNTLRAGVLGANDGLVSVFSLVMGVAGAGASTHQIMITGFAGLLSGALSMALGEWLSVQSSRELYQNQLSVEKQELEEVPEEEIEELTLIYQAKGLDLAAAQNLANKLLSDPNTALDTLAREELSIDPEELGGSPWVAAGTSFLLFAVGALIPVLPYFFFKGIAGIWASAIFSALGLFVIGAVITLMTGRNLFFSGMRQVLFGLATAAITFGIGWLIGANLGG